LLPSPAWRAENKETQQTVAFSRLKRKNRSFFFLRRDITHDACASERNPDPKNGRGGHKGQGATGAGGQKAWCHERAWRYRYGAGYGGMSKVWKKNMENQTETNIRATDQHITHQQRRTKAQTAIEIKP